MDHCQPRLQALSQIRQQPNQCIAFLTGLLGLCTPRQVRKHIAQFTLHRDIRFAQRGTITTEQPCKYTNPKLQNEVRDALVDINCRQQIAQRIGETEQGHAHFFRVFNRTDAACRIRIGGPSK